MDPVEERVEGSEDVTLVNLIEQYRSEEEDSKDDSEDHEPISYLEACNALSSLF